MQSAVLVDTRPEGVDGVPRPKEFTVTCVVDLQPAGQGVGLLRWECLVEGGDRVGVEIVHDQDDLVRVWVLDTQEMFDALGPVDSGAGGLGVGAAPTRQGFGPNEDRAGAAADVLAVLAGHLPGPS